LVAGLLQLKRIQLALADEQKEHRLTQGRQRDMETGNAAFAQEVRDLRERLDAQDLHRHSLEEKHQQARDTATAKRQLFRLCGLVVLIGSHSSKAAADMHRERLRILQMAEIVSLK
jgi:hypothetical protein